MATEVTADNISGVQRALEKEVIAALSRSGLDGYEIDSIVLKPKADANVAGLLPGCELKCKLEGFPPKLKCEVVCG